MDYFETIQQYYQKPVKLELLSNTVGNSNGNWIDTSHYGIGATQSNVLYQPVLTDDVMGVGRKAYVFDGSNDSLHIQNAPNLIFSDGIKDKPFTIEFTFIFKGSLRTTGLLSKQGAWEFFYYSNSIRFYIYSGGSAENFIAIRTDFIGEINKEYAFKMTYNGSGTHTGVMTYLNGVIPPYYATTTGTYVAMSDSGGIIDIAKTGRGSSLMGAIEFIRITEGVV
jgi:hypothetical protein